MNNFTLKAKLFALTVMIAVSSVACDNGGSIIQDAQNDVNSKIAIVDATITTASDMVDNTVNNACGFATATLPECQ